MLLLLRDDEIKWEIKIDKINRLEYLQYIISILISKTSSYFFQLRELAKVVFYFIVLYALKKVLIAY